MEQQYQTFCQSEPTANRREVLFKLRDSTDGFTPITGQTFSGAEIQVSKNGGTFANAAGTVAELAGGVYRYQFTAGELDTLGNVRLKVDKTGALIVVQEHEVRTPLEVYENMYTDGAVYVASWGGTGSVVGIDGGRQTPVSTIAAAYTLSQALEVRKIVWLDNHDVSLSAQNWDGYQFVDEGNEYTAITVTPGTSFDGAKFHNISVKGAFPAGIDFVAQRGGTISAATMALIQTCVEAALGGTITFGGGVAAFIDCYQGKSNGSPVVFDVASALPSVPIEFIRYAGDLAMRNVSHASGPTVEINMAGGTLTLEATCTTGTIRVTGHGRLIDSSNGSTVDTSAFKDDAAEKYADGVHMRDGGSTGTVVGTDGTRKNPVSSISSLRTVADALGIRKALIHDDFASLSGLSDFIDWEFVGVGESEIRMDALVSVDGCHFKYVDISGTFQIGDHGLRGNGVRFRSAQNIPDGFWSQVFFEGTPRLASNSGTRHVFWDVVCPNDGFSEPELDVSGVTVGTAEVNLINVQGDLTIKNHTGQFNTFLIVMNGGTLKFDSTNTGGSVLVRGHGRVIDNSGAGCTVDTSALITPELISGVAGGAWDELTADHSLAGSFGLALATGLDVSLIQGLIMRKVGAGTTNESSTFPIKKGDLEPPITDTLEENGVAKNLSDATQVQIRWRNRKTGTLATKTATIVDAATGSVKYDWAPGDTDTEGIFDVEWIVTWSGGGTTTYPGAGYTEFEVTTPLQ